jgi:hypothetical protein
VVLRHARTAEERQYVVNVIAKNWKRVGQVPRKHMLMWDTVDGSPPADAQLSAPAVYSRLRHVEAPRVAARVLGSQRRAGSTHVASRRP